MTDNNINNQINNMQETITKIITFFPSFNIKDKIQVLLAYSEFVETMDNILSKYDGRKYRMSELINELNKLNVSEDDDE